MELCWCKLSLPAIRCRKLEQGHQIRVIAQVKMQQYVWGVVEDGMHHKPVWLMQAAG